MRALGEASKRSSRGLPGRSPGGWRGMRYPCAMLILSLLRHAKSSWDDPSQKDFERPLSKRGETAAPRVGAFMAKQGLAPDLVLCSPAVRARQTLDPVLPHLAGGPTVVYEDNFYLAAPSVMLARVRSIEAKVRHVLIVGHDPGMHELALELSGSGEAEMLQALAAKFPTAGLAVIGFKARTWSKVGPGKGRLQLFVTPKTLA
jgi:phosphohistidine phosphatase